MILTLAQASAATGKAKSTILRAIKSGRLSASRNDHGEYLIDASELGRVYVVQPISTDSDANDAPRNTRTDATMHIKLSVQAVEIRLLQDRIQDLKESLMKVEADKTRAEMLYDNAMLENRQLLLMLTDQRPTPTQVETRDEPDPEKRPGIFGRLFKRRT